VQTYRVDQKSKLLISSEYVNRQKLRREIQASPTHEEREQIRTAAGKMKNCLILIFSCEIFYVTIVLCSNILRLKAVNEITARQTRKHDVMKVCNIAYLPQKENYCCQLLSPEPFTKL